MVKVLSEHFIKMCIRDRASPVLLEPIMKVEVTMPEEYMGDVIGDINSRRGRIEGMDDIGDVYKRQVQTVRNERACCKRNCTQYQECEKIGRAHV